MRLLKLIIHNIASIEDATIDFESEPLASSEVFLITGKTGSGKSTILDAICLALFANTPRLKNTQMEGKIRDAEKELTISDPTQLMRRNTGEAFVSLTFLGSNGVNYEATWSVQRAFKRPTANLQPKRWQLRNLDTDGDPLTKDKEIQAEMNIAIGLDFNQFCRTTMLAQGEFTRFLNSRDDEKAAILEKITGVDIYTKIGRKVYETTSEKEALWHKTRAMAEGVRVLGEEELGAMSAEIERLSLEQTEITAERDEINKKIQGGEMNREAVLRGNLKLKEAQESLRLVETKLADVLRPGREKAANGASDAEKLFVSMRSTLFSREEELQKAGLPELRRQRDGFVSARNAAERAKERLTVLENEKRRRVETKKSLEDMSKNIERKQSAIDLLLPQLREAEMRRDVTKQLYERQREWVDRWAKNIRAKLQLGDVCPVCQQKVTSTLPAEAELDSLFHEAEIQWRVAERAFQDLQKKHDLLAAEVKMSLRLFEKAQETYDSDVSVMKNQQLAEEACHSCGLQSVSDDTPAQLDRLIGEAQAGRESVEKQILAAEAIERAVSQLRREAEALRQAKEKAERTVTDFDRQILENEGRVSAIKTLIENIREEISEAEKKMVEFEAGRRDEFIQLVASLRKRLDEIGEKKGELTKAMKLDEENRERMLKIKEEVAAMEKDFCRWARLNQLIGDATGNKFRKIAQSYVLGSLIHAANGYMRSLTDRYTLHVEPGTFVISIEDAYQGFVRRAATTISGGESFLVSLSLALALSDIGNRLSVDTLFIDEGFGSLSGVPLQNAINTLRSLHGKSGRQVGIISHVEELRDRIRTNINVIQSAANSSSTISITSS